MTINIKRKGRVVLVELNRPQVLNALNSEMMNSMLEYMKPLDQDPDIGCFVLTGAGKSFAAGADIRELEKRSYLEMLQEDYFAPWESFSTLRTPKIAAVSGYALGGGCELAMMCDLIFAADNAFFGQPEIKLGVIPGMGGTQRLTRLIGKAKAMDMILSGRTMSAEEAERSGLIARIFPLNSLLSESLKIAETIAGYSKPAVLMAKETVDRSMESGLREGILFERRIYHALFSTHDQKEGMRAFIEKRKPEFKGK